jgi:hypothetical protein
VLLVFQNCNGFFRVASARPSLPALNQRPHNVILQLATPLCAYNGVSGEIFLSNVKIGGRPAKAKISVNRAARKVTVSQLGPIFKALKGKPWFVCLTLKALWR